MNRNAKLVEKIRAGDFDSEQKLLNLRKNAIRHANDEVLEAVNQRLKKCFPKIYTREVGPLKERHRDGRFSCFCNHPKSLYQLYQDIKNDNVPNDALLCEECWNVDLLGAWGYYGYSKKRITNKTWKKLCELRTKLRNVARSVNPYGSGSDRDEKNVGPKGTVHCPDCVVGRACGHFHVYVIELSKNVLVKKNGFPFEGELDSGKKVYYVGQTLHSPECRYKQHVAARNNQSRNGFYCNCFTPEKELREFTKFNRPGKYVARYHKKGGLRPELYFGKNPAVRTDIEPYTGMMKDLKIRAEQEEKKLAYILRSKGHAVHYN